MAQRLRDSGTSIVEGYLDVIRKVPRAAHMAGCRRLAAVSVAVGTSHPPCARSRCRWRTAARGMVRWCTSCSADCTRNHCSRGSSSTAENTSGAGKVPLIEQVADAHDTHVGRIHGLPDGGELPPSVGDELRNLGSWCCWRRGTHRSVGERGHRRATPARRTRAAAALTILQVAHDAAQAPARDVEHRPLQHLPAHAMFRHQICIAR